MRASIHNVRLTNRVTITLIFNIDLDEWIIINNGTAGSIRGRMDRMSTIGRERTHHYFWIGTREYELVVDPTEDGTAWESFSFFDIKKQSYIEGADGKINA